MLVANIYALASGAEQKHVGRIYVDDGKVWYDLLAPEWHRLLWKISRNPANTPEEEEILPKVDPDRWLRALPTTYRGSYVWATLEEDKSRQSALPAEP